MAAKRLKGGSATGGTGDLKPQILTLSVGTGVIDDYAVVQIQLPVPRFGPGMSRATITEILKVWFYPAINDLGDVTSSNAMFVATTNLGRANAQASTLATLAIDFTSTRIIAAQLLTRGISTNGGSVVSLPVTVDLTDQNGNGVLVASDTLFLVVGNVGGTAVATFVAKLLYRTVNVGVTEYVGILQSQQ